MASFDFTDRTAQFPADEGTNQILTDTSGSGFFFQDNLGVPDGIAGHVSDTSDTGASRGSLRSNDRHFQAVGSSPQLPWDLRVTGTPGGLVSCTWTGWVYHINAEQGYFWSIHDPVSAAGQAIIVIGRETNSGGPAVPWVAMADGLSLFNFRTVKVTQSHADIALNTWQFVAGGWDAVRNKVFVAWGVQPGEFIYNEADGFAAGFQYTLLDRTKVGFWNGEPGQAQLYVDHCLWFKGRALSALELEAVWNNHVGIDFNLLTGTLPNGVGNDDQDYIMINNLLRRRR